MTDLDFADELKRMAARIGTMILHTDPEWVDVEIQIASMRDFCRHHAPEKLDLFEMVYVSRLRHLWELWGPPTRDPLFAADM